MPKVAYSEEERKQISSRAGSDVKTRYTTYYS